ncbi:hypothetical protein LTR66_014779 [Elasticomyces elasticus]|nr:hypothetical protein LTR66_014779 [Elasticomyces elasticus]
MNNARPYSSNVSNSTTNAILNAPWRKTYSKPAQPSNLNTQGEYYGWPKAENNYINIYAAVDSWRSYANDNSNLHTSTRALSSLSPEASPFVPASLPPTQARRHYTPYQPLRVSNGVNEKAIVEAVAREQGIDGEVKKANVKPPAAIKYKLRSKTTKTTKPEDEPIASIEPTERIQHPAVIRLVDGRARETTRSPTPPSATELYKAQAQLPPQVRDQPQKLLVILDLNGTLLYRSKSNTTTFHMRPGVGLFLEYLFKNHVVMVYTSAVPQNCGLMVDKFLHPHMRKKLAAVWARDRLDLTKAQYSGKVQVYKKLSKVWADASIQAKALQGERWSQANTVLIDDSQLKGLSEPHNLVQVPEYTKHDAPKSPQDKEKTTIQLQIMKQLEMKLEELKWQVDVTTLIRAWQNGEREVPRVEGQEVVVEETVDQKMQKQQEMGGENSSPASENIESDIGAAELAQIPSWLLPMKSHTSSVPDSIPGLGLLSDEETGPSEHAKTRQISADRESSVDEDVFRDLLKV